MDLYQRSIEVILQNQNRSGAYIASPNFQNYHYCWLRDSSFIAYAMDLVGEHQSAEDFFGWVNRVICKYAYKVDRLEEQLNDDPESSEKCILHTRFTLEGSEEDSDSAWGNFQVDGYGTWLWALAEHIELTGKFNLLDEYRTSINTTIRYLKAAWQIPNYDCWEEHPEYLHPYSLAALYGGLEAISGMAKKVQKNGSFLPAAETARSIRKFLLQSAIHEGRFVKHLWPAKAGESARPVVTSGVDASLLGLAVPYGAFQMDDPIMANTFQRIEEELRRPDGGVYRYKEDNYYGGGEWILLTAWLGCCLIRSGDVSKARELLAWIESCADHEGNLPEQVNDHNLAPDQYKPWVERWGEVASPLLWSHAMYLILFTELKNY